MVSCLRSRYDEDLRIYTYIGNVLVAINPFQTVNIYDEQAINLSLAGVIRPHRTNAVASRCGLLLQM